MTTAKRCPTCSTEKPLDAFGKCKKSRDGLRWECKACRKAAYQANSEEVKQQRKEYYQANSEAIRARVKQYREANPERVRQTNQKYDSSHAQERKVYISQWRKENFDKLAEYERIRRATKSEELREYDRQYRRSHPEKEKAKKHRRRAREAAGGRFTDKEWLELCALYKQRCLCCGSTGVQLTPDHVIPLSCDGLNTIDNIQPLCLPCNLKKGAKTIDYRLIEANTWPDRWTGEEIRGDILIPQVVADGVMQPILLGN